MSEVVSDFADYAQIVLVKYSCSIRPHCRAMLMRFAIVIGDPLPSSLFLCLGLSGAWASRTDVQARKGRAPEKVGPLFAGSLVQTP